MPFPALIARGRLGGDTRPPGVVHYQAPPAQVQNLALSVVGPGEIGGTFDLVTGATAYHVERSLTGTGGWAEVLVVTTGAFADFGGLSASTQYFYRVSASNGAGTGAASATANATTSVSPLTAALTIAHEFLNSGNLGLDSGPSAEHLTNVGGVTQVADGNANGQAADFVRASSQRLRVASPATAHRFGTPAGSGGMICALVQLKDRTNDYMFAGEYEGGANNAFQFGYDRGTDRLYCVVSPDGTATQLLYATQFGSPPLNTPIFVWLRYDGAFLELGAVAAPNHRELGKFDVVAYTGGIAAVSAGFALGSYAEGVGGGAFLNGRLAQYRHFKPALQNRDLDWLVNAALTGRTLTDVAAYAPARKGPTTAAYIQYVPGVTQGGEGRGTPYLLANDHAIFKPAGAWWAMVSLKLDPADYLRGAFHRSIWCKGLVGADPAEGSQCHYPKHADLQFDQFSTEMATDADHTVSNEALGTLLPVRYNQWHTIISSFDPARQAVQTRTNCEILYGTGKAEVILATAAGTPTRWGTAKMAFGANHDIGGEFNGCWLQNYLLFDGLIDTDLASGAAGWLHNGGFSRDLRDATTWAAFQRLYPSCVSRIRDGYPFDEASGARKSLLGIAPDAVPWLWNVGTAGAAVGSGAGIGA